MTSNIVMKNLNYDQVTNVMRNKTQDIQNRSLILTNMGGKQLLIKILIYE